MSKLYSINPHIVFLFLVDFVLCLDVFLANFAHSKTFCFVNGFFDKWLESISFQFVMNAHLLLRLVFGDELPKMWSAAAAAGNANVIEVLKFFEAGFLSD